MTQREAEARPSDSLPVPALEPGDRLSREEFERRYEAMPHLKEAELIEGVVFIPSPVRLGRHGNPHGRMITWLGTYEASTPGVLIGDNSTARLDLINEPQPDALLLIDPFCGGQARITADDYVESAPELVAEVASSSASYDMHTKLEAYQRNGVREHVVWRVLDQTVDWFVLRSNQFQPLPTDQDSLFRSRVFPGLWLDAAALVGGDPARVLTVVQQGTAAREHADFVARLKSAAGTT